MRISLACTAAALLLFPAHARAYQVTDGFTGGAIDAARWTISASGGNTVALDAAHHRVVQTQAGQDGASGLTFHEVAIEGDFDVSVSYTIVTPRAPDHNNGNQERVALCIDQVGCVMRVSDGYFGSMSDPGGGELYLVHFSALGEQPTPWPGAVTADLSGKLRFTRVGSTGTGWYWNGEGWTALHSATVPTGPLAGFSLSVWNGYHPQDGMQLAFDDFTLSAPATAAPAAPHSSGGCASGAAGGVASLLLLALAALRPWRRRAAA